MIINHPEQAPHHVLDYDITLLNGVAMSFTIDADAGDVVEWDFCGTPTIQFKFAEKPSPTNPDATLAAEEITIFKSHIVSIAKRQREITPIPREIKEEFQRLIGEAPKSIN